MRLLATIKRAFVPFGLRLGTFNAYAPRGVDPMPREPQGSGAGVPKGSQPLVTIVTPSMNQGSFLGETIASVAAQDYPNIEHIVIDGGSTDNSVEILKSDTHTLAHWVSEPDEGQTHAINKGFAMCSGEILAWLNADDLLLPGAVSAAVAAIQEDNDVVYGHRVIIDADSREVGRWVLPKHRASGVLWRDYVPQETMFWTRSIHERVGGLDEGFSFAMDWDLVVRFWEHGARFRRLDRFMGCFRTHGAQKSLAQRERIGEPEFARIRTRLGLGIRSRIGSLVYLGLSIPCYWAYKLGLLGRS